MGTGPETTSKVQIRIKRLNHDPYHTQQMKQTLEAGVDLDRMAISVADSTFRRLIEGVGAQLNLLPIHVDEQSLPKRDALKRVVLIVADHVAARRYRDVSLPLAPHSEEVPPALVALVPPGNWEGVILPKKDGEQSFDGLLVLPQSPATVLAQLSVILYAHRAYVSRFNSAMEELNLNRRIFRSVTSGISIAKASDAEFPLVYVNPAFEVMTGYSLEEVEGKNCRFLQGKETDQPGLTIIREALQQQRETVAIIRNFKKDGTPFWNELSLSPIYDRNGIVTHFVGIQNDVTGRVAFEEALRDSEKLAALGRLAASIAHEINNPLGTVTNLMFLARYEESAAKREEYFDLAEKELARVALLTTQSLRFYRQSSKPTAVRPVNIVSAVLDVYAIKFANLGLSIVRKDSSCQSIVCLESEIRQVVSNLVRNAIDAMQQTVGRLQIRVREATLWKTLTKGVLITVADSGTGMSRETINRLYTAFYTTKGQHGTGLGLWVSFEIVQRHHGALRVRSSQTPGHSGSVFQLFLPYQGVSF